MAEAVYVNGTLLTMDRAQPVAEAMAIAGNRILAVGSNAEIENLIGPQTRRVNLEGRLVLPGFHDAHTHQLSAGLGMMELNLKTAGSLREMQQAVRAYGAQLPAGEWIVGRQWDSTGWPEGRLPEASDLDGWSEGRPAYLERADVHAAVANTAALRLAGITAETAAPAGGRIERHPGGAPSGMLYEGARALVTAVMPAITAARRREALRRAMGEALRQGVTSVQDYSGWEAFTSYEELQRDGALAVRVTEWLTFAEPLPRLEEQRRHHDPKDVWLRTGMLKAFLDGSLGSRTAALLEPYADDPGNRGLPQYEAAELLALASERARAGFQLGFHAIGDLAARMALDTFEGVQSLQRGDARNRIEHLQVVAPQDVVRMQRLGVVASVQPSHLLSDMRWAESRLGSARVQNSYLWNSLRRGGVRLALGSDAPVEPMNPMLGVMAAVGRGDGEAIYPPKGECMTLEDSLYAYTMGGAMADFQEDVKGSLTAGKLADCVVLSQDLRRLAAQQYAGVTAIMTMVGGEVKHHG